MSPVFDDLRTLTACQTVTAANIASFVAMAGPAILFLTGDTVARTEAADVAVAVRELLRGADGRGVRLGIVDRRDEPAIMQAFGVVVLPALVLLRDGGAVQEIVARIRDWPVYAQAVQRLRTTTPQAAFA